MEPVEIVRLNITDIGTEQLFTDDQLNAWLASYDDNVNRATYRALVTIATSEVLKAKVIKTQDLSVDGSKVAETLLKLAATYKAEADADEDDGGGFLQLIPFRYAGSAEGEEAKW